MPFLPSPPEELEAGSLLTWLPLCDQMLSERTGWMELRKGVVVGCVWGDCLFASRLLTVPDDTWDGHLAFCLEWH